MNRTPFVNNEYYHIYNRGTDKRLIVTDDLELNRFIYSIDKFNSQIPIGSLHKLSFNKHPSSKPLVELIAYCVNPNHFHFILKQLIEGGVSEFMKRLSGGYTWHFNKKHQRNGVLFQGRFKSKYINSNEYLLYLSAYINLNFKVHQLRGSTAKLYRSSWNEYIHLAGSFCHKDIILNQFPSIESYKTYAQNALDFILFNKEKNKTLANLLLE